MSKIQIVDSISLVLRTPRCVTTANHRLSGEYSTFVAAFIVPGKRFGLMKILISIASRTVRVRDWAKEKLAHSSNDSIDSTVARLIGNEVPIIAHSLAKFRRLT